MRQDLACFLQRLTLAGLRLIEAETPLKAQATCSGDETADIILQYYLPFITQEKPHNGLKPHEGTKSTGETDNQVKRLASPALSFVKPSAWYPDRRDGIDIRIGLDLRP